MYMPEGPEVWILSKAINSFFSDDNTMSVGKHLIVKDCMENWSFGLNGKVMLSKYNEFCCVRRFGRRDEKHRVGLDEKT